MEIDLLNRMNAARRARKAVIRVTAMDGSEDRLVLDSDDLAGDLLGEELTRRFRSAKSGMIEVEGAAGDEPRRLFLTVHVPPPRLVIVGAVHISQALAPMAAIAGLDVLIVDPRTAFATPERFPNMTLLAEWPVDVMDRLAFDRYTALAAVTHDPKIDDEPLKAALTTGCFYVGALGSRKTHAKRIDRLSEAGLDAATLARINAPIGLDIGAASPAEIAVSVLAQIIEALRKPRDGANG
ncbi:MAG: XdhC/CoxF family protein [Hyphomicrobiales bacterium]|nr:MAG: XdhC/CoxF family protein [Hyphomicrobiales bacterium]